MLVNGPAADNGAFDVDGSFVVTGGVVTAVGSSGMAQSPDQHERREVLGRLERGDDRAVLGDDLDDRARRLVDWNRTSMDACPEPVSSPELQAGSAYEVVVDGTSTGTVSAA